MVNTRYPRPPAPTNVPGMRALTVAIALMLGGWPGYVGAQAPPGGTATAPSASDGDERGALRLGGGGDMRLTLGGYAQADGRWISGASQRQPDGLLLRRARLVFDAAMPSGWHLRLQPDFGQGRVVVQDAFVGRERGAHILRVGRFRPAFGTERMQSSATLLSPERGLVNSLMPSRSFGAQWSVLRPAWRVDLGGFRTPIGSDASPVDTDGDVDAVAGTGHDVLVRVALLRQRNGRYAEWQAGALVGRERGTADGPGVGRILSVAQQPILSFRNDGTDVGTVRAAGLRQRYSTGMLAGSSRGMMAVEGGWLRQQVERGGVVRAPTIAGATLRLARVWGGVRRADQVITPRHARGAIDAGVRAGIVAAWGPDLSTFVTRASTARAVSGGAAISWLPTPLTRLTLAYDLTDRRRAAAPREHALQARWQQGF